MLEARLEELEEETKHLTSSLEGLREESSSRPQRKPSRKGRRGRGKRRAKRGQRKEQFLAAVKKNPGATAAEIAREIGVSPNQAYGLARRLQRDGTIVKSANGYKHADQS
jgi:transposase